MNYLKIDRPLISHNEDAPAIAHDNILIVCDGLGGSGTNKYVINGEKKTSAYLGSRLVSKICDEYIYKNYNYICENMKNPTVIVSELKENIKSEMDKYVIKYHLKNKYLGKSMQMLPTTLVAVIINKKENNTEALVISAGDSRAFILTPEKGLQQISKDDTPNEYDVFSKFSEMTNNISQNNDFKLNYIYYNNLPQNSSFFACSDGCFDYIPSIIDLDFYLSFSLANYLQKKNDILTFENILIKRIEQYGLQDDISLAGALIYDYEYQNIYNNYVSYIKDLKKHTISPLDKVAQLLNDHSKKNIDEYENNIKHRDKIINKIECKIKALIKEICYYNLEIKNCNNILYYNDLININNLLVKTDFYQNFLVKLNEAKDKVKKITAESEKLYTEKHNSLYDTFKKIETEKIFSEQKLKYNQRFMIEENKKGKIALEYMNSLKSLINDSTINLYHQGYNDIYDRLKRINAVELIISDYLDAHKTYRKFIENEYNSLNVYSMSEEFENSIKLKFTDAYISKFKMYRNNEKYDVVCSLNDECKSLMFKIENELYFDDTKKIELLENFLNENYQKFTDFIKQSYLYNSNIFKQEISQLNDIDKNIKEYEEYEKICKNKRLELCSNYKKKYELFKHGMGGSV